MRNYYLRPLKKTSLMDTQLLSKDIHWVLYDALVCGAADTLNEGLFKALRLTILDKDVDTLFKLIGSMDSYLQCYSSETPVSTIRSHRQIISFLKKYPFSPTESRVDRRSVAQSKFWAAERQCQLTNTRLTSDDVGIPSWVPRARDIISSVLEELTPARIMKIIAGEPWSWGYYGEHT